MQVKDVMNTHRVVTVEPDDTVAVAARLMSWAGVRHLPVIERESVIGVFSESDYLRCRAEAEADGSNDRVRAWMTAPAVTLSPEDPAVLASAALLSMRRAGCVAVIDAETGKIAGVVTASDVLAAEVRAVSPGTGIEAPIARAMRSPARVVHPYEPLLEAVALMSEHGMRHVPVVDDDRRLVGIVSDRDVRTAIGDPAEALHRDLTELEALQVSSVMTTPAESVAEDEPLLDVANRLAHGTIGALPVVDPGGRVVGLVSYVDVMQRLLELISERSPVDRPADGGERSAHRGTG